MVTQVKYTPEQEKELYDSYIDCETMDDRDQVIDRFIRVHGKKRNSVIAKLSSMGIYKSRVVLSKVTGEVPETKASIVKRIELMLDVVDLVGLSKTPKLTLLRMLKEK